VATFTMLNLFIGIIVDTMQTLHEDQIARDREMIERTLDRDTAQIESEVRALREEIRALRRELTQRV
jgi:voltage-gated sodium channel